MIVTRGLLYAAKKGQEPAGVVLVSRGYVAFHNSACIRFRIVAVVICMNELLNGCIYFCPLLVNLINVSH